MGTLHFQSHAGRRLASHRQATQHQPDQPHVPRRVPQRVAQQALPHSTPQGRLQPVLNAPQHPPDLRPTGRSGAANPQQVLIAIPRVDPRLLQERAVGGVAFQQRLQVPAGVANQPVQVAPLRSQQGLQRLTLGVRQRPPRRGQRFRLPRHRRVQVGQPTPLVLQLGQLQPQAGGLAAPLPHLLGQHRRVRQLLATPPQHRGNHLIESRTPHPLINLLELFQQLPRLLLHPFRFPLGLLDATSQVAAQSRQLDIVVGNSLEPRGCQGGFLGDPLRLDRLIGDLRPPPLVQRGLPGLDQAAGVLGLHGGQVGLGHQPLSAQVVGEQLLPQQGQPGQYRFPPGLQQATLGQGVVLRQILAGTPLQARFDRLQLGPQFGLLLGGRQPPR